MGYLTHPNTSRRSLLCLLVPAVRSSCYQTFFVVDNIGATAQRTGFVQRTSKITGQLFLALVTFGTWSEGKTTLAQLATKGTPLRQPVEVSPEAIHQRMNKKAMAFLQEMLR